MNAKLLATSDNTGFWLIGTEVYRAPVDAQMDVYGHPDGKRWECSMRQWNIFRHTVFGYAKDVPKEEKVIA